MVLCCRDKILFLALGFVDFEAALSSRMLSIFLTFWGTKEYYIIILVIIIINRNAFFLFGELITGIKL